MRQTRSSSQSDVRDLLIPCLETEELAWQQAFQHGDGEVWVCVQFLSLTLCHPIDYSPPGSSVHGISQAKILERVDSSYSRGSSRPKN